MMSVSPATAALEARMKNARYALRSRLAAHPSYLLLARRGRHRDEAVDAETDVVIEGFPRSANTFAAIALQVAQPRPVRIAHHLHAAASIVEAVRHGVPTLLLVRDPTDTVLSEVVRERPVSIASVLGAYCRFYETVRPYLDGVVVGEFDVVTSRFDRVVTAVNDRFGTAFTPFRHTQDDVATVFRLIDQRERDPSNKLIDAFLAGRVPLDRVMLTMREGASAHPVPEASVPRPAEGRRRARAELEKRLTDARLTPLRRRAEEAYGTIASRSA